MKSSKIFFASLITLSLTTFFTACKKDKGVECSTEAVTGGSIQGVWQHDYPKQEPDFSHPDQYNVIRFVNDSFYLAVTHRSDMMHTNGCNEVEWTEYAKGKFTLGVDKIYFNGLYTEADYTIKTGGCYGVGAYTDSFSVTSCSQRLVMYGLNPALSGSTDRTIRMVKQ